MQEEQHLLEETEPFGGYCGEDAQHYDLIMLIPSATSELRCLTCVVTEDSHLLNQQQIQLAPAGFEHPVDLTSEEYFVPSICH